MPVSFAALPPAALDEVVSFAQRVPGVTALVLGHEVYQLGLQDVATGATIDRARRVATRFVVEGDDKAIAMIETTVPTRAGSLAILGLLGAPGARDLYTAAANVDESRFSRAAYELRVLHLPALYVSCLWFHASSDDVLVPYGALPATLSSKAYAPAAFFKAMKGLARKRVAAELEIQQGTKSHDAKRPPATRRRATPRKRRRPRTK